MRRIALSIAPHIMAATLLGAGSSAQAGVDCTVVPGGLGIICGGPGPFNPVQNSQTIQLISSNGSTIESNASGFSVSNTGTVRYQGPLNLSSVDVRSNLLGGFFNSGSIFSKPRFVAVNIAPEGANPTINGDIVNTGVIEALNDGTSFFANHAFRIAANVNGDFLNSGTVKVRNNPNAFALPSNAAAYLIECQTCVGDFVNSGSIINDYVEDDGLLIMGFIGPGVGAQRSNWTGDIRNTSTGVISATDEAVILNFATLNGNLINEAGGRITGAFGGYYVECGVCVGEFRNGGLIEATEGGSDAVNLVADSRAPLTQNWTGNVVNEETGNIVATSFENTPFGPEGGTGIDISFKNISGDLINRGKILAHNFGILTTPPRFVTGFPNPGGQVWNGRIFNGATGQIIAQSADGHGIHLEGTHASSPARGTLSGGIVNEGLIRGGDGPDGSAIINENYTLGAPIRNSGTLHAKTALELRRAPATTFIQTAGLTKGDIQSANQDAFYGITNEADVFRFIGGQFEGAIVPDALDRLFFGEAGGASNKAAAFVTGQTNGLSRMNVESGSAVIGATAKGVNGGGYVFTGLGTLTVANGAELYLDDDSRIEANTINLAQGATLNYFLTTDTTKTGKVLAAASATVSQANLKITLDPVTFAQTAGFQFTFTKLIDSPNLDGPFASATVDGAGASFAVTQTFVPNNSSISVTVTRIALSQLAGLSASAGAVAAALETALAGPAPIGADLAAAINAIFAATPEEQARLLSELSGEQTAGAVFYALRTDDPFKSLVADRLAALKSTGCKVAGFMWCEPQYAMSDAVRRDAEDPFGWITRGVRQDGATSIWGRVIGSWSDRKKEADTRTAGFIAGADHVLNSSSLLGAAFQYTGSSTNPKGPNSFSDVESYQAGLYGAWGDSGFFLNGNLGGIWHRYDTSRTVTSGGPARTARAKFDGQSLSASLEAGTVLMAEGARVQPWAGLSYVKQWTDAYRETGAGGLSLDIASREAESLRSTVGVRVAFPLNKDAKSGAVELRAAWTHEFLDTTAAYSASFVDAPQVRFLSTSGRAPRDTAIVGAGVVIPVSNNTNVFVDYDAGINKDAVTHTGSVGLRMTW